MAPRVHKFPVATKREGNWICIAPHLYSSPLKRSDLTQFTQTAPAFLVAYLN